MEIVSDPYPFPSHVHITSSVTIKLTDQNYLLWKPQIESLLSSQKLMGFVTGREIKPPATISVRQGDTTLEVPNPKYEAWECTDQLIRSWIFGTLSEEVLGYVVGFTTSHEIWSSLADNFNKSSLSRVFELRRKLQMMSKKGKTFTDYCRDFRVVCDQLSSIGEPVDESMKIFNFLTGLGREYDPVCAVIQHSLSKSPSPSFNDVLSEVSGFDSRLQTYEEAPQISPHMAFHSYKEEPENQCFYTSGNRGRGSYSNRSNYRGRGGYSSRGRGFPQQVSSQQPQHNKARPTCQICGKNGHTAIKCWNRFDNNYQNEELPQALAALQVSDNSGKEWFPDSGATSHIVASSENLTSSTPYHGNENLMVADGNFLPITHIGSTNLSVSTGSLPLNDIVVCPSIQKSLLSVSKLCEDYPCGVFFDAHKVYVLDLETKKVLTKGPKRDGLYVLENQDFKAFYSSRQQTTNDHIWHHRLGHANQQILQHLHKNKAISINKSSTSSICGPCQMGKSLNLPFSLSDSVTHEPLARIHCDLWGPSPISSVQGFKYYVVFVDDFSRFSWFFPLRLKSDFYGVFLMFQRQVENQFNKKIKVFQSDGGGEFISNQFTSHLINCGIKQRISCPYTAAQNGVAERKHRHLVELSLAMLFHSNVPLKYWVEAFYTANYIINLLPSAARNFQIPHETLNHEKPIYTALRVFGSACYPCLRPYAAHKLEPRSLQCVFLGYNASYKGYRCLYPPTGKVYISRHVLFDETQFPFAEKYKHLQPHYTTALLRAWQMASQETENVNSSCPLSTPSSLLSPIPEPATVLTPSNEYIEHEPAELITLDADLPLAMENSEAQVSHNEDIMHPENSEISVEQPDDNNIEEQSIAESVLPATTNVHPMATRSKSGIIKPNPKYALFTLTNRETEPKTVKSALKDSRWNTAMSEEIADQKSNSTWHLVPATPDMHILGCKWVFRIKLKADGTIEKFKARLVAKGYHQEEGIDYLETFSPVVRTATIRTVLGLATAKNWAVTQLDVKCAFLHGDLHEDIYMTQPAGFEDSNYPSYVCKLDKAIYGLKQAPRAWFDKFSIFLIDYGFICSTADPSMFVYSHHGDTLILLLYVDDIILTGSNTALFKHLTEALSSTFSMKDLGCLHYFLGIQVEQHDHGMFLNQQKYAEEILIQAGLDSCKSMPTPLPLQLDRTPYGAELFPEPTTFRSLAGKLQYLTLTRPDLQFAVNFICQRMHAPTLTDWALLKRILRYVRGTTSYGLNLSKSNSLSVTAFSDSDWAGCKETRRSTTGFCTFLGSTLVSWSAKRQPTVSRSSTEAEYRALAETAAELTWLSSLLRDLNIPHSGPAQLYCDNLSAVYLTTNPSLHSRTKHFELDWHYIRERVALGFIETIHIPAEKQTADIFTKSLPRAAFEHLRDKLGVGNSPTSSLKGANNMRAKTEEDNWLYSEMGSTTPKPITRSTQQNPSHDIKASCKIVQQLAKTAENKATCKSSFNGLLPLQNRFDLLQSL